MHKNIDGPMPVQSKHTHWSLPGPVFDLDWHGPFSVLGHRFTKAKIGGTVSRFDDAPTKLQALPPKRGTRSPIALSHQAVLGTLPPGAGSPQPSLGALSLGFEGQLPNHTPLALRSLQAHHCRRMHAMPLPGICQQ
jgi:hypothetical protein